LTERRRVAAAVLAAGLGTRFGGGGPKPLVELAGRPLLAYALAAAIGSELDPVVCVVHGAGVARVARAAGASVVVNEAPDRGISSSLHAALRALEHEADVDAVVVGLADQPLVGADAYRRLASAFRDDTPIAVATYGGERANPVLIGRALWGEALGLEGDEGARALVRRHGAREVPCDGTGDPTDVDTPEDLDALEQTWRSRTASE
jgi:CTP:molybdopterin cytidylyltransferase MocA